MNRISGQLNLIFLSFFLLVIISAGGTIWGLRGQSSDALAINLAGRQRMLIQWMTRLAVEPARSPAEQEALNEAMRAFEETLQALRYGGPVHYPANQTVTLPAASAADIQAHLLRLAGEWQAFHKTLQAVQAAPSGANNWLVDVQSQSAVLLADADLLARLYQDAAGRRSAALAWAQGGFFVGASLLLLGGIWVARRSILRPLAALKAATARIGSGDLETGVPVAGPLEMADLARAFDSMRRDLLAAHLDLLRWNQTLEARVDERTLELDALYEVSREITSRLDLNAVFRSVTEKAHSLLKADTAFLCLLNDDQQLLRLRSNSGPEDSALGPAADAANPFVRAILNQHTVQQCPAAQALGTCGVVEMQFRRSHLVAPLWIDQRRIGALCVGSQREAAFNADAPRLLERLAGAAAVAIENARLYRQAERLAAIEERQRIAAAMHDGLAQTIDSIGLLVDQAGDRLENGDQTAAGQTLSQAYERICRASTEVRQTIASLVDEPPAPTSLQARLEELITQMNLASPSDQGWQVDLPGVLFLPEEDTRNVLGVVQEALINIRRHAQAKHVGLKLSLTGDAAELKIEDDGCGFDQRQPGDDSRRHFGLKILQARAA